MQRERFIPHSLAQLEELKAFPPGAMPEVAYNKLVSQYEAVDDVTVERVTYEHDGLTMNGLISTPQGTPKGTVIYNRGGSGNYGIHTVHAVMRQFVPFARAGYVVVGSNYRGNDGGEGKDEFGGRDVEDALALYELAKAKGPTHLIGHSRGGMQAFLMLKRGFEPNSLIAIAPVCDLIVWNQQDGRMREHVYKRYIPGFLDDEEGTLKARSVLEWPEAVQTPTLILHGTKDEAVPHSQSESLNTLLTNRREFHLYEGGNHALTRHWDDVLERSLKWMAAHE